MRYGLEQLKQRALRLRRAGLYPSAEQAVHAWRVAAEAQDDLAAVVEACTAAVGIALDRDRPALALRLGADVLPRVAGTTRGAPEVRARLYIMMAKAAWGVGRDHEVQSLLALAQQVVERESVDLVARAHLAVVASIASLDAGDPLAAAAWAVQGADIAGSLGDEATLRLCRHNLSYVWSQRGDFERARAVIAQVTAAGETDSELVDVLVDAVHVALASGDLAEAGEWARRAIVGYCEAPSALSPISIAFLFEALGAYYAARGLARAATWLWELALGWFALRERRRDMERVRARLLAPPAEEPAAAEAALDADLLYLGDLFQTTCRETAGVAARELALSVNRLLERVAPGAQRAPGEHAALQYRLTPGERWFTGRSAWGRAAESVLSGQDARSRAGLDVLAAYERLAGSGAGWGATLRFLQRSGLDAEPVAALDRLYREATA
jgi:hypothetical protein